MDGAGFADSHNMSSLGVVKGEVSFDKESHIASMPITWKGRQMVVKIAYNSSKVDPNQVSNDLDKALAKLLALEEVYQLKSSKGNRALTLTSENKLTREFDTEVNSGKTPPPKVYENIQGHLESKLIKSQQKNEGGESEILRQKQDLLKKTSTTFKTVLNNSENEGANRAQPKEIRLEYLVKTKGFIEPVRLAPPIIKTTKSIDFGIKPIKMSDAEIEKCGPDKILDLCGKGVEISVNQLLHAASKIANDLPKAAIDNPSILTTLHKLYDKAAEKLMAQGKVTEAFTIRSMAAINVNFTEEHPLHNMEGAIRACTGKQADPGHGAHFSNMDSGVVKGGNLRAWSREIDGRPKHCFEFKVSKFARNDIEETLTAIRKDPEAFSDSLLGMLRGLEVEVRELPFTYAAKKEDGSFTTFKQNGYTPQNGKVWEVTFPGIGRVTIGSSKEVGCMVNEINVELDANLEKGEGLQALHQMLTVLGCGPILGPQRPEDNERMKVAQLFRTYFPKEAIKMEQAKEFYELPLDDLKSMVKEQMMKSDPARGQKFEEYLNASSGLMKEIEIFPGRKVWAVMDVADQMRTLGAHGLMTGIGQSGIESGASTACIILKEGALSTQDRFMNGAMISGVSSERDLESGGGDQVFTRLVNNHFLANDVDGINFAGEVQVLWDLDVVNRGCYGYPDDRFGVKHPEHPSYKAYENRLNPIDSAKYFGGTVNEVMIKNRIGPEFVKGFMVRSWEHKEKLIKKLTGEGLIKDGKINGHPIDQFIYVSKTFHPCMWSKKDVVPQLPKPVVVEKQVMQVEEETPQFLIAMNRQNNEELLQDIADGRTDIHQEMKAYHGYISFQEAESLLQGKNPGTYIICNTSNAEKYDVVYLDSDKKPQMLSFKKNFGHLKDKIEERDDILWTPLPTTIDQARAYIDEAKKRNA